MSTGRKFFENLTPTPPLSTPIKDKDGILARLLKVDTLALTRRIMTDLNEGNPVLNPKREKQVSFNQLAPSLQDALAFTIALDTQHSANYKKVSENLRNSLEKLGSTTGSPNNSASLNKEGEITHIKHEKDSTNYHRSPHPVGCALAASKVASTPEKKDLVSIGFNWHDIVQDHPKIALLNEVESAYLLMKEWSKKLDALKESISAGNSTEAEIKNAHEAIEEYKKLLPYICWKTIVAATTMLKSVSDGQPTLHAAQKEALEAKLPPDLKRSIQHTDLDDSATIISLVDSNLAALNLRTVFGNDVPLAQDFLNPANEFGIREDLRTLFELSGMKDLDNPTEEHNKAAFLFGNNMGMFPELAKDWGGLLSKLKFPYGEGRQIDGVTAWNRLSDASRNGDDAAMGELLNSTSISDDKDFQGKTMSDIFIARLQGEIDFANNQHPEVYEKLLAKGEEKADIDTGYSQRHAARLTQLKENYPKADKNKQLQVAKALVFLVAHPPGIYVDLAKRIENIEAEKNKIQNTQEVQIPAAKLQKTEHPSAASSSLRIAASLSNQGPDKTKPHEVKTISSSQEIEKLERTHKECLSIEKQLRKGFKSRPAENLSAALPQPGQTASKNPHHSI